MTSSAACVAQRPPQAELVWIVEPQLPLGKQRANQRVAVGMEPGRRQAEDDIADLGCGPVEQVRPFDHADTTSRQVERIVGHQPRMLGGLAAHERTARLTATGRDRADELGDAFRDDMPDRDVIEERKRFGAAADDVVGAHRHEIDADRVEAKESSRDRRLRADAVGGGDQQRFAVSRGDGDRATEPTEPADHLRPPRRFDFRAHEIDRAVTGRDIDARCPVRAASTHGSVGTPAATGSSSMCLRLATSYGTGSG